MSLDCERPESYLGMLMALEGVSDGFTIIHGPTGCKYYPASVSETAFPDRGGEVRARNLFRYSCKYFFSQPRLPCTYLDMGRFVTGATERLKDLYSRAEKLDPSLISVINSPGASLIGEDLNAVSGDIPTVRIDHAEYSGTCADGFQDGVLEILKVIRPEKAAERKGVNLLGLSLLHLNWEDTAEDLKALLGLCGIDVRCTVGAGWSVKDIRESAGAELNVLVYPEYGDRVASFYEREYGIPSVDEGVPLGFSNLERWISAVCGKLGKDPSPALAKIKEGRRMAARSVALMESFHLLPKGHTFSVHCDGSLALAATEFLYDYLGMVPVAVTCPSGAGWERRTREFVSSHGIPFSDDALHTEAEIMLTSGTLGISCVSRGLVKGYAELEAPGTKYVNVRPEPPIGLTGTLRLVDSVLNIIASRQRFI
ncbi:MAG: hypothetical protein IIT75_02220 [Candidatus Methanomethylophilus sp.]|nr:hypothetical protein [Methanomethylophilus sp.]